MLLVLRLHEERKGKKKEGNVAYNMLSWDPIVKGWC